MGRCKGWFKAWIRAYEARAVQLELGEVAGNVSRGHVDMIARARGPCRGSRCVTGNRG